jgi:HSP20 family protein
MTLTRWQKPENWHWTPLHQLSNLRHEIDRIFENPFSSLLEDKQSFFTGWGPALDLYEDKDSVYVKAEVPGMKKEEIEISLHQGTLTLSGERKEQQQQEGTEPIRTERFTGRFSRSVSLPASVDGDKVKASYRDGILTVVLPKSEEAKPKQIQIKGE